MRGQRNVAQMKEQNKIPEEELKKMMTSRLLDAKFNKEIGNIEMKMGNIKKNQSEMKNTLTEMKNTWQEIKSNQRFEDQEAKNMQSEQQK